MPDLLPAHFKHLRASGLRPTTIETIGVYSVPVPGELSPILAQCESVLAFPYPGQNGYCRYRLFPPQGSMKYFQEPGSPTHLYIPPSVRSVLANPNIAIAVTEGEKKSICLSQFGIPTIGIPGVWSWGNGDGDLHPEFDSTCFIDRDVLVVFDSNAWRKEKEEVGHALYALGKALENRGAKVEVAIVPPAEDGSDQGCDDLIAKDGIGKFKELKRIKLRHDGLAQFKPWWENWRKTKKRKTSPASPLAHAIDAFGIAPILTFWSPVHECGKSVAQSIVSKVCPKSLEGSSLSEAVVFRVVEKFQPTIFCDEAADMLANRPELLSLFRASHMRNKAFVYRSEGDSHDPRDFSTWSPKSLAITTTKIENALASRCLIIRMQRQTRTESKKVERFSATKSYPELAILCRKAARWVQDNLAVIRDAVPQIPDIENRNLDNYEPLLQIAHVIGGEWPQRINDAALKLIGGDNPVEQSRSIELLKDIKAIFAGDLERDVDGSKKIGSANLVKELVARDERPWSEYSKGKPITQNQVGRLLKDYSIYSRKIWVGNKPRQGYVEHQFKDAFERYLPQDPPSTESEPEDRNRANENEELSVKAQPEGSNILPVDKNDLSIENTKQDSGLPVEESELDGLNRFSEIWALDSEFHALDGRNPSPLCFVAYEPRSGKYIRLLEDEFPSSPPYGIGAHSLILAYAATAELRCHLSLGWPLPKNVIDLYTENRLRFNFPGPERGKGGLFETLDRLDIPHIDPVEKKRLQKLAGGMKLDGKKLLTYCQSDVDVLPKLFLKLLSDMDIDLALERGRCVIETAVIEHRGIPIAVPDYENLTVYRKQIRLDLIAQSPVSEIYVNGSFSYKAFKEWLKKNEIDGWDVTQKSNRLVMAEDYLCKVVSVAPVVQPVLDLVLSLKAFKKCPFGVDSGRTHADQVPFGAVSGRNAPSGYVLTAAKLWRWVIQAPEGTALIYCDYSNEEFAIAAFKSGDPNMVEGYALPDVYQSVADQLGVSRKNAKVAMLAIQYGAGPKRLENSLGIPYGEARKLFEYHKDTYAIYWKWSDAELEKFKAQADGWGLRLKDNDSANILLTVRNFPIQGTAASILRRVVIEAAKSDIEIIGPLHDAVLIQAPAVEAEQCAEKMCRIMKIGRA